MKSRQNSITALNHIRYVMYFISVRAEKHGKDDPDMASSNSAQSQMTRSTIPETIFLPLILLHPESNYTIFNDGNRLDWIVFGDISLTYLPLTSRWLGSQKIDDWHLDAMFIPSSIILKVQITSDHFFAMQLIRKQNSLFISVREFILQIEKQIQRFGDDQSTCLSSGKYCGLFTPSCHNEFLFDAKLVLANI